MPFLSLIPVDLEAGAVPIYIEVLVPRREELIAHLATRGIQTRPFYPDLDKAAYMENPGTFPRSEVFGSQGLFLPSGPDQPLESVDRVIEALRAFGALS